MKGLTKTEAALIVSAIIFILAAVSFRALAPGDMELRVSSAEASGPVSRISTGEEGRIDINSASAAALTELPGIGETLSARIIAYREEHGPFARIEDLMDVEGIGESTFERIRDLIRVSEGSLK